MGTWHAGGVVLRMHSHNGYHPASLKITAVQCLLWMVLANNPVSSPVQRTSGGGAAMEVYIRTDFLTSRHANQTRNEVKSDVITHAHLHNWFRFHFRLADTLAAMAIQYWAVAGGRNVGTSGAGAVLLRSAQMMGQPKTQQKTGRWSAAGAVSCQPDDCLALKFSNNEIFIKGEPLAQE